MPRTLTTVLLLLVSNIAAAGNDWTSFRGSNGDGRSDAKGLPAEFSDSKNVAWKTAIHGKAWSSPVIAGNQIWMTTAPQDGKKMYGVCVNRGTGKIIHDLVIFKNEKPYFCHESNSYATPTPVIDGDRVYLHFGRYGTACLGRQSGKTIWSRRDLECDHFRAPGSSPIVHGNLLVAAYDGVDVQYMVAMNKMTGKTVWRKDRGIDYGTNNPDRKKAYSTPAVIQFQGRPQLISPSAVETISYVPETGEELWRVRHGGMNAAARPVFGHGLVYIAAGSGNLSFVAVRPDGKGDVTKSHVVWSMGKSVPKRSSQILLGNLLFMISDSGITSCLDAKSGKVRWQQRIDGSFWASPVYADGKIYFSSKEGHVVVVKASPKYELLAENELESGFNASPAIVGKALYLRSFTHLYRIEKK